MGHQLLTKLIVLVHSIPLTLYNHMSHSPPLTLHFPFPTLRTFHSLSISHRYQILLPQLTTKLLLQVTPYLLMTMFPSPQPWTALHPLITPDPRRDSERKLVSWDETSALNYSVGFSIAKLQGIRSYGKMISSSQEITHLHHQAITNPK